MSETSKIPGAQAEMSLSQAILAPLNSMFKAQIHAGRSFLSYVLQMGYPHVKVNKDGSLDEASLSDKDLLYTQKFRFNRTNGENTENFEVSIPTLALIPVAPLAIDSAEFEFDFKVSNVSKHQQIQESEKEVTKLEAKENNFNEFNRPWYLVKDPVSLRGGLLPGSGSVQGSENSSAIKVKIKVSKQPLPAGLDKLLTTLNQISDISNTNTTKQ